MDFSRESRSNLNTAEVVPKSYNSTKKPERLSIIEKKRLQWQKEREELSKIEDYDPWGRHLTQPNNALHSSFDSGIDNANVEDHSKSSHNRSYNAELDSSDNKSPARAAEFSHHRGKGMASLDLIDQEDVAYRRSKQKEYQDSILVQIEEKKRIKELEKQEMLRREHEDELRIRRDQERLRAHIPGDQSSHQAASGEVDNYLIERLREAQKEAEEARHARVTAH
ncbi:coiled-coil domain containing 66, partial [Cichlidogyrus casuarinus]